MRVCCFGSKGRPPFGKLLHHGKSLTNLRKVFLHITLRSTERSQQLHSRPLEIHEQEVRRNIIRRTMGLNGRLGGILNRSIEKIFLFHYLLVSSLSKQKDIHMYVHL